MASIITLTGRDIDTNKPVRWEYVPTLQDAQGWQETSEKYSYVLDVTGLRVDDPKADAQVERVEHAYNQILNNVKVYEYIFKGCLFGTNAELTTGFLTEEEFTVLKFNNAEFNRFKKVEESKRERK
jgi:hypothetical protein